MTDSEDDRWAFDRRTVGLVAVANLLPLLGLGYLEWGVIELLVVYWVEAFIGTLLGLAQMVPARLVRVPVTDPRREPVLQARHGTVSAGGLVSGYVRTLPIVVRTAIVFAVLWSVPAVALVAPGSPLYYASSDTLASVAVVAGTLAGTHVLTTWHYVREQRYEDAGPVGGAGLATCLGVFGLAGVLLLTAEASLVSEIGALPVGLAYVTVGGKVALSLRFQCRQGGRFERLGGDADPFDVQTTTTSVGPVRLPGSAIAELPRVEDTATAPQTTVRPSRSSVLRASPILGIGDSRVGEAPIVYLALATLFAVAGVDPVLTVLTAGLAGASAVLPALVIHLPRHASVAYGFHDDRLVCRDRWTSEPVWSLSYDDIESVDVERGIAGRVGDYGTVVVETADDRPARLRFLRRHGDVTKRLEAAVRNARRTASASRPRTVE